jgi:hypothetical protein
LALVVAEADALSRMPCGLLREYAAASAGGSACPAFCRALTLVGADGEGEAGLSVAEARGAALTFGLSGVAAGAGAGAGAEAGGGGGGAEEAKEERL